VRAHRKRFTTPKARSNAQRVRAIKSLEGVQSYRHSAAGRALRAEQLGEQWQKQSGVCPRCSMRLALGDAKFENKQFERDAGNRAIHKRCPTEDLFKSGLTGRELTA